MNATLDRVYHLSSMSANAKPLALLQASVDLEDESEFRMLVDNQHVKYITIDGGLYDVEDMCFEPVLKKRSLRSRQATGTLAESLEARQQESRTLPASRKKNFMRYRCQTNRLPAA